MTINEIAKMLNNCALEKDCSSCPYDLFKDDDKHCQRFLIKRLATEFEGMEDDLK